MIFRAELYVIYQNTIYKKVIVGIPAYTTAVSKPEEA